jgi:class 3 adenylate cyclase
MPVSNALRGYVHESARSAIECNRMAYLSELRRVTTMFVNIVGLEECFNTGKLPLVQHVMEVGLSCFSRFSGTMRQYVVDDKGCVMIGAFGLPSFTNEDNNARAIDCASYIRDALHQAGIQCMIGITCGLVYCGLVGTERRCEYAMMGSSVNLSARLMASCTPDDIRVDKEVYNDTKTSFSFETLAPINAKGYTEPVAVYRPTKHCIVSAVQI